MQKFVVSDVSICKYSGMHPLSYSAVSVGGPSNKGTAMAAVRPLLTSGSVSPKYVPKLLLTMSVH